jgi:hypothetical protein
MQFDVGNDTVRKQITAELRTLYDSHHAFIVRYYQVCYIAKTHSPRIALQAYHGMPEPVSEYERWLSGVALKTVHSCCLRRTLRAAASL